MKKRAILFVALLVLAGLIVTACGNSEGDSGVGEGGHMTVSMAMWNIGEKITDPEVDLILGYLYDRFNITIEPRHVTWDDYEQVIPIWAATGQLPDWFAIDAFGKPFLNDWVREEIIRPIPDDLSRWPYIQALVADFDGMRHENGNFYGIPRPSFGDPTLDLTNRGILIRKDWMEHLGYDPDAPPANLDAFIAMIKDLVENNPEQNPNTVGVTFIAPWSIMIMSEPWNYALNSGGGSPWMRDGDMWNQSGIMPAARDAVLGLNRMWQEGILDRDLPTLQEGQGIEKFSTGRAAAYVYNITPSAIGGQVKPFFNLTYPDREFGDMVTALRGWNEEGGAPYYHLEVSAWSQSYFNADISDEAMYRILDMMDFLLSEEGQILYNYGIEGKDFNFVNGVPVSTRTTGLGTEYEILNDWGWFASWNSDAHFSNVLEWGQDVIDISIGYHTWWLENGISNAVHRDNRTHFIIPPTAQSFFWMITDDFVTAVTNNDAGAAWDRAVSNYLASGGQQIIDEMNEITRERGVLP